MSRRIEIELTSSRPDGSWTWRAAGARVPKGVVQSTILPADVKVGDLLRAEVETELDGTNVLSVSPLKAKAEKSGLLEILPSAKPFEAVTQQLARKERTDRREGGARRDGPRRDGPRRERREGEGGERPPRGEGRPPRRDPKGDRDRGPRPERKPRFQPPPELPYKPRIWTNPRFWAAILCAARPFRAGQSPARKKSRRCSRCCGAENGDASAAQWSPSLSSSMPS